VSTRAGLAIAALIVVIAGGIFLLASGDPSGNLESPSEFADPADDVVIADGPEPPAETDLADIVDATVRRRGDAIVFRAEMGRSIPQRVKGGGMSWRWDIYEGATGTWILSADLDTGPTAALTSTQTDYGSSTFDRNLPGRLLIEDETLTITLRPDELERWPSDFEWTLGTSLDGAQGNARSALATDIAPDQGRGRLEG
jgi:hypothetical protein